MVRVPRLLQVTLVTEVRVVTMGECVDGVGGPRPGQREELRLADKLDRTLLTNTGDQSNVLQHGFIVSFGLLLLMLCNPGPDNQ